MMVFGGDEDDKSVLEETRDWFSSRDCPDSIQPFILMPLPGTPFYSKMGEQGRILTKDWSLYDAHHEIIRFAHFNPGELQEAVHGMYEQFYSLKNSAKRIMGYRGNERWKRKSSAMVSAYATFIGIRQLKNSPQTKRHTTFLKSLR